jgi:hypothetical protein
MADPEVEPRRRPHVVVEAEYIATQRALNAAKAACDALLKIRHSLMEDGFPAGHSLCESMDDNAARWAVEREAYRVQLRALKVEGGL